MLLDTIKCVDCKQRKPMITAKRLMNLHNKWQCLDCSNKITKGLVLDVKKRRA